MYRDNHQSVQITDIIIDYSISSYSLHILHTAYLFPLSSYHSTETTWIHLSLTSACVYYSSGALRRVPITAIGKYHLRYYRLV